MGRTRTGHHRSGNPARRAAAGQHPAAATRSRTVQADLWPFAVDYFVASGRLSLYPDTAVLPGDPSGATPPRLRLPGVGLVDLDPTGLDTAGLDPTTDRESGATPVAAAVLADPDGGWSALLCPGPDAKARMDDLLNAITEAFLDELGRQAAADYAQAALAANPMLADPTQTRAVLDAIAAEPGPAPSRPVTAPSD